MTEKFSALPQELAAVARAATVEAAGAPARHLPAEFERELAKRFGLSRRQVRTVTRHLVDTGELTYTWEHGCSFLERSYRGPVKIGERVVLVSADRPFRADDKEVAVRIAPGSSFGSGRHPTTRLALRGVEQVLDHLRPAGDRQRSAVLDIGTGSGVLVIAAVKMGVGRGLGIDTDPCARFEARRNVQCNRLADRIRISKQAADRSKPTGRYDFVLANLRLPTLVRLASSIGNLANPSARLVLSGIQAQEMERLLAVYRIYGFDSLWRAEEKGWSAVVLERPRFSGLSPGEAGSLHPADGCRQP